MCGSACLGAGGAGGSPEGPSGRFLVPQHARLNIRIMSPASFLFLQLGSLEISLSQDIASLSAAFL
jgi:hypothetical protein